MTASLVSMLIAAQSGATAEAAQRELFVVDETANSVVRVDPMTGAGTVVSAGGSLVDPTGIAVSTTGDIFVADRNGAQEGRVIRVDRLTGAQTTVSSGGSFEDPVAVMIGAGGNLLVVDREAFGGDGGVISVNPTTGAQTTVSFGDSFMDPEGITTLANGDLLVVDSSASKAIRVSPSTGAQTALASGGNLATPSGVAYATSGHIYVADPSAFSGPGGVIRVNPGGSQTPISSAGVFQDPIDLVVLGSGDLAVVDKNALGGSGGVIGVDPADGLQTTISTGGPFQDPVGIALPPDGDGDEVADYSDNCPSLGNPLQGDLDADEVGDDCDDDDDGDGITDDDELADGTDPRNADTDSDGTEDGDDNCATAPNPEQDDVDGDRLGDVCDADDDDDSVADGGDNCPGDPNVDQEDVDRDGIGDACDDEETPRPERGRAPAKLPPPRLGTAVNIAAVAGVVRFELPARAGGRSASDRLRGDEQVPVGTVIDARRGTVLLTSARPGRLTQSGKFRGGRFTVRQGRSGKGLTDLVLTGTLSRCRGAGARSSARRVSRRLWGDAKGRFRTRGHRSAATVRGTRWLVADRCDGTLTRVIKGVVEVRDLARRRTVVLRKGQRYLARSARR